MAAGPLGAPENVSVLLEGGADIETQAEDGRTGLIIAAGYGPAENVLVLLSAGADRTVQGSDGKTALDHARDNEALLDSDAYRQLSAAH